MLAATRAAVRRLNSMVHRGQCTMSPATSNLAQRLLSGDVVALSKAITLVESTREDHKKEADLLQTHLIKQSATQSHSRKPTFRVGISGSPGVGKSSFIDSFGSHLTSLGHKVAVLAVDPTSVRTGGSILGDKTRMSRLSQDPNAYIRPSPTRGNLGGVTRSTSEAILLCEVAGFDVVVVETVGVGQSEVAVEDLVDMFVLLLAPAGGDELQGIKKGIVEVADMVVVNKADGELKGQASATRSHYRSALQVLAPKHQLWSPRVLLCSSLQNQGFQDFWDAAKSFQTTMINAGIFDKRRQRQRNHHLWEILGYQLVDRLKKTESLQDSLHQIETDVTRGKMPPGVGADTLISLFFHTNTPRS
eukprot:TRINITY_DN4569_c0_g1_i2.p1 TRINITY_DN4569_c0_g1~~TRINITY_DN4569_c0_g1_i2.p1  ORF type:complete len:361 (+),score=76.12 TRINITY_DN4569_c0_g1_i2:69-1151(+)